MNTAAPAYPTHETQAARLLALLLTGRHINPLEAWQSLGIYKAARAIFDIRALGWPVKTEHTEVKNRFGEPCHVAEYSLPAETIAAAGEAGRQFVEQERNLLRRA